MEEKVKEPLDWHKIEELASTEIVNVIAKYEMNIRDGERTIDLAKDKLKAQRVMPRQTDCIAP